MHCSMPGFPVCHQLSELAHPYVHRVGDVIHTTMFPNVLLDKLMVALINLFVYLSTVLTQMYLSHPFSGSSKRDWADTLPHSLWPKLLRVWCLRPTQQHTEVQRHLWSWGPNSWHQKLFVGWKMIERVCHLPKLPPFPPPPENVSVLQHIYQTILPGAFEAMQYEQNRGKRRIKSLCA